MQTARLDLALRLGAAGDFRKAAALIDKDDPMRARNFRKLAEL